LGSHKKDELETSDSTSVSTFVLRTSDIASLMVDTILDSVNFTMTPISAEPQIIFGSFFKSIDSFMIYIDVTNTGRTAGLVNVIASTCCYAPTDAINPTLSCAQIFGINSDLPNTQASFMSPAETVRFRFSSIIIPYNQSGYCTFYAKSGTVYVSNYEVGWIMGSPTMSPNAPSTSCDPPYVPIPDPPYCQPPCTIDQVYNTNTGICDPVDCITKYKGGRNVYDPRTGVCKPSSPPPPSAPADVGSPVTTVPTTPSNGTSTFPMAPDGSYSINCGEHGTFNPTQLTCDCHPGWITDLSQTIAEFVFCNVQSNFSPDTIYDQQEPSKSSKHVNYVALITALVVLFVVLLVTGLLVRCLCCNSKARESKKSRLIKNRGKQNADSNSDSSDV
jgi:hypothetical protein